ncbi:putative reverse transcriptase domain-containing protein [Tanacetum coccineum]
MDGSMRLELEGEAARVYVAAPTDRINYAGNAPYCNKYRLHHYGQCPPKCGKCHRIGHPEKDCRVRIPSAGVNSLQDVTCYGCGEKGHLRNKCPKGRNQQNEGARGRAYVVVETPHQNPNVVTCRCSADGKFVMRRLSVFPFRMARYLKSKVRGRKRIRDHFRVSRLMRKKHDAIHIVRDFPEVFLDDLTGLPPMREIEFRIDLIPGPPVPVVKCTYHFVPSEMLSGMSNHP